MGFTKKFHNFSYQKFSDFIYDLVDHHGFWGIRFSVPGASFSEHQLTHAGRDIADEREFIGAWKARPEVKRVSFTFFTRDERGSIRMLFDLEAKSATLEHALNVSPDLIADLLRRHFVIIGSEDTEDGWFKYWKPELVIAVLALLVALISIPWWPTWYSYLSR